MKYKFIKDIINDNSLIISSAAIPLEKATIDKVLYYQDCKLKIYILSNNTLYDVNGLTCCEVLIERTNSHSYDLYSIADNINKIDFKHKDVMDRFNAYDKSSFSHNISILTNEDYFGLDVTDEIDIDKLIDLKLAFSITWAWAFVDIKGYTFSDNLSYIYRYDLNGNLNIKVNTNEMPVLNEFEKEQFQLYELINLT